MQKTSADGSGIEALGVRVVSASRGGCGGSAGGGIALGERPDWMRARAVTFDIFDRMKGTLGSLHTVCESARCPNLGECWRRGTATFMIMGDICTRSCRFCAVKTGRPDALDPDEPHKLADAARQMGLRHVVITSVARDELPDGGAAHFAACIRALYDALPGVSVEVLTPDFKGRPESVRTVLDARPSVFNHNLETVPRLTKQVRVQARYDRSLDVLRMAFEMKPEIPTKSGLMLGLGEEIEEVLETLQDMRRAGVSILTLGQYLRPSKDHLPVVRWVSPDEFTWLKEQALEMGFVHVESGPLVRSSYHAEQAVGAPLKV
jgi:lipoic acid synthetase